MSRPRYGDPLDGRLGALRPALESIDRSRLASDLLRGPLSTAAFWVAIALPAIYLPLLLAGIRSPGRLALFLGLFGVHVLALWLGRGHVGAGRG